MVRGLGPSTPTDVDTEFSGTHRAQVTRRESIHISRDAREAVANVHWKNAILFVLFTYPCGCVVACRSRCRQYVLL